MGKRRSRTRSKSNKEAWAKYTPEERSAIMKARLAAYTPEKRRANTRAAAANKTQEERSLIAKRRWAKISPKRRSERAKKSNAALTAEQKLVRARKALAARMAKYGHEGLSQIAIARQAKYTPEERSAIAKKGNPARMAKLTPAVRADMSRVASARFANWKAAAERLKAIESGAATAKTLLGTRLRAAREEAGFSRSAAVKGLEELGVLITVDAIKNHESDTNRPRPDVRRGYAKLYGKPKNELFGG